MRETYDKLKKTIADCEDDLHKAAGGNKAAGTRVRQALQEVKNIAQQLRQEILGSRKDDKPE